MNHSEGWRSLPISSFGKNWTPPNELVVGIQSGYCYGIYSSFGEHCLRGLILLIIDFYACSILPSGYSCHPSNAASAPGAYRSRSPSCTNQWLNTDMARYGKPQMNQDFMELNWVLLYGSKLFNKNLTLRPRKSLGSFYCTISTVWETVILNIENPPFWDVVPIGYLCLVLLRGSSVQLGFSLIFGWVLNNNS